ncbi:uncharacterized protein APUU_31481S [Aspergillus puulaauensis]|uniref:Uncharacterized protein n=1 Tax=Aspergillus puulaauensis TaxID=1220207 RepID=A0A7R7XKP7_9EURO|nr:uncharacterized protein APUU_31481S [Aspergillus puulaauensis]BCS23256.1 hypothetical protein APUU_31481S [Aspergillus puulaauensis]
MRFRIANRLLSSPTVPRRSFHNVSAQAKDPMIFENSLEKTLEEHRSVNRACLIRKVVSGPDSHRRTRLASRDKSPKSVSSKSPVRRESQSQLLATATQSPTLQNGEKSHGLTDEELITALPFHSPMRLKLGKGQAKQRPWLSQLDPNQRFLSGVSQLDAELRALEKYLTPTMQEVEVADQVTSEITDIISNPARYTPPSIIRTGFEMSHSDLKLMISVPGADRHEMLRNYTRLLKVAWRALGECPKYELRRTLGSPVTRVVVHKPTGLSFRLHCADAEPAYIERIRYFHSQYPELRCIYIATQLILTTAGAFGSRRSSISREGLQMLIAAFLKMSDGRFRSSASCGESFLAFLHLFGTEIDLLTTGVTVDPPGFFDARSVEEAWHANEPKDRPPYLLGQRSLIRSKKYTKKKRSRFVNTGLLLQDPTDYMQNLGHTQSRTPFIQHVLATTYENLELALKNWNPAHHLTQKTSVLDKVLHVSFEEFESRRASILAASTASNKT